MYVAGGVAYNVKVRAGMTAKLELNAEATLRREAAAARARPHARHSDLSPVHVDAEQLHRAEADLVWPMRCACRKEAALSLRTSLN